MSVTAVLAVAVFVGAYVVIATEKVNRSVAALTGAALMVVIGAVRGHQMFFSEGTGIDWNVIFLLFGMMILVGILSHTGVFEYLAIWSAQLARGRPFRMMVTLSMITAIASALLDNVTTVLLIAPVTLLLCDRLALDPVPFLLSEVMASNIGGTATLIGDPPNIIIASRAGLSFNDFLVHLAPIVVVLLVVFIGLSWLLWGRHLRFDEQRAAALLLEPVGQLGRSGRFAGTIEAGHQNALRWLQIQPAGITAQQFDQFIVENFDDLLPGRNLEQHFSADRLLADGLDEFFGDFEIHIRLQQGHADFLHGVSDVGFADAGLAAQLFKGAFEFFREGGEHREKVRGAG